MNRRSLIAAAAFLAPPAPQLKEAAAAQTEPPASRFVPWQIFVEEPTGLPSIEGHTDTVPDIVGRIGGDNDLVIFTEGNHFPVLLGGEIRQRFRSWAKVDQRFADLDLREICIVTLPQPIIVTMLRERGLRLGNAIIDVSPASGFFPDIIMAGVKPLRELRHAGLVMSEARIFARNMGFALLVRSGNPMRVETVDDLKRPDIHIVMASASEPGARSQYRHALESLLGKDAMEDVLARETVAFDGRIGVQHRDVLEALAKNHGNVGIIFRHLARYYERAFPDLAQMVVVPGAERFASTIAMTTTATPLRPRAAAAFEEFYLGIARDLYPAYAFATMTPEEFGRTLALG